MNDVAYISESPLPFSDPKTLGPRVYFRECLQFLDWTTQRVSKGIGQKGRRGNQSDANERYAPIRKLPLTFAEA